MIEISDSTLKKLGKWPLPRDYHASLIDVLKLVPVDEVGIEFFSPNHPIVIRKSFDMDGVVYKYIYVLSPIKI